MSTAADEELMDEYDDDDSDDEGIFEDEESIYGDEGTVDHKNPVITREEEQAQVYEIKSGKEKPGGGKALAKKRQLVAQADKHGKWFVAVFEGKKQVTKWKPPTKEQAVKLDKKGRIVKGGVIDDDREEDETDDDTDLGEDTATGGITLKKVLIGTAVVGILGVGGWFVYKKIKSDDDAEVDEVDD